MTRQEQKEEATKKAAIRGLALFRRKLTVHTVATSGMTQQLSESDTFDEVWHDALLALAQIDIPEIEQRAQDQSSDQTGKIEAGTLIIHTDGGSRGNPGPSATGFVIETIHGEILEEGGEYLGITTNNQAEYQAVKLALEHASKHTKDEIRLFIDSMLVVNQMKGIYKIKNRELWPIHSDIKRLSQQFKKVSFTHVPREKNKKADSKVNEVLDSIKNRKNESTSEQP